MKKPMIVTKIGNESQAQADARAAKALGAGASKAPPDVEVAAGSITISGNGAKNEPISIVITKKSDNSVVFNKSSNLDQGGSGTVTIPLPADSYHITLTASPPGVDPVIYEIDVQVP